MKLTLDLYYDPNVQGNKGKSVELEICCGEIDKRVSIYMIDYNDYCDQVEGWFCSKEDIIKFRDELNKIINFI